MDELNVKKEQLQALRSRYPQQDTYNAFMHERLEEMLNDSIIQLDPHAPDITPEVAR